MKRYKIIFGIDVSKDQLDIYKSVPDSFLNEKSHFFQVRNTQKSINKWLKKIANLIKKLERSGFEKTDILFVLEPTGTYSIKISNSLSNLGYSINMVNPRQSSAFMQALNMDNKDDKQSATALAQMGYSLNLPMYKAPSKVKQQKKQLQMALKGLVKQKHQLGNQLHALEQNTYIMSSVSEALKTTLETVNSQIILLEKELGELDELEEPEYQQEFQLLTSITGIGAKTARLLLLAAGSLTNFKYARQVSKFVGLTPTSQQSGSSVRKNGRMTKKGNSELRSCLYMATRSAIKYNKACRDLYQRLRANGKPYKKAVVAVMNKLVKQAFGVVNSKTPFDNNYYLQFKEN